MHGVHLILPGTGRWHREAMTEGGHSRVLRYVARPLHHRFAVVALPVSGRI